MRLDVVIITIALVIFISYYFFIIYQQHGIGIGIRNYGIHIITGNVPCSMTLRGVFDQEEMIHTLNSYAVFDYHLYGPLLMRNKEGVKSYTIRSTNDKITRNLLVLHLSHQGPDSYTLDVIFNHALFDMEFIFQIMENYLKKDYQNKPLAINRDYYWSDRNIVFHVVNIPRYFRIISVRRSIRQIPKEVIET